jgi:hypothetical protein
MKGYNKQQETYLLAKSNLAVLEAEEKELESKYIKDKGIVNPDGSIPRATWAIDDDKIADMAINEFGHMIETTTLWKSICDARELLKVAEDNLLEYAISILPAGMRGTMQEAVKANYTTRIKAIETVMKLDTRTVKR